MKKNFIKLTEDEFYEKFTPTINHLVNDAPFGGTMYETFGKELEHINWAQGDDLTKPRLWTIEEVEGRFYFVSGYHYVNRFGYLITEEAVPENEEYEVLLDTEVDEIPTAKFVKEVTVIDPDTKGEITIEIYKHENGGMFGVDSSFLEQGFDDDECPIIQDPLEPEGMIKLVSTDSLSNYIESVDLPQD